MCDDGGFVAGVVIIAEEAMATQLSIRGIVNRMKRSFESDLVQAEIDDLLLTGRAKDAFEAEEMFLDVHTEDIVELTRVLSDSDFQNHEAVKLLMSHGSRRLEDALG